MQQVVTRVSGRISNMKAKIKISTGKFLEIEGKVIDKRMIFGRKECLIEGKLLKPIWISTNKISK